MLGARARMHLYIDQKMANDPSLEETEEKIAQTWNAPPCLLRHFQSRGSGLFVWLPSWCSALSLRCDLKAQHKGNPQRVMKAGHSSSFRAGTAYRGDMGVYINLLSHGNAYFHDKRFQPVAVKSCSALCGGQSYTKGTRSSTLDPRPSGTVEQAEGSTGSRRRSFEPGQISARYKRPRSNAVAKQVLDRQDKS